MLTIARATPADDAAVADLVARVWDDDYVGEVWSRWVADEREMPLVARDEESRLVGVCHLGPQVTGDCWFSAMRVDPTHHRHGIGSALTQAAITMAKEQGYRRALLGIDRENAASLAMTARNGFRQICEYGKLTFKPGGTDDATAPRLRAAGTAEMEALYRLTEAQAKEQGMPAAAYYMWEWCRLTPQSFAEMIDKGVCLVLEDQPEAGYVPFWVEEGFAEAWTPVGSPETIVELVRGLRSRIGTASPLLEVWLPDVSPCIAPLGEMGAEHPPTEGYTIWEMEF